MMMCSSADDRHTTHLGSLITATHHHLPVSTPLYTFGFTRQQHFRMNLERASP